MANSSLYNSFVEVYFNFKYFETEVLFRIIIASDI